MKKYSLFAFFAFLVFHGSTIIAQESLPDTSVFNASLQVRRGDSLTVYFICTGAMSDRQCADYYRVGKIDPLYIGVGGPFTDFYASGKPYLKAVLINSALEGKAQYFYENGKLLAEGQYKNNIRFGRWTFYYPNGAIEKQVVYEDLGVVIENVYAKNGKILVTEGQGEFNFLYRPVASCTTLRARGKIVNGRPHGRWTLYSPLTSSPVGYETFENGVFVKGESRAMVQGFSNTYTERSMIAWYSFQENEHLNMLRQAVVCPGTGGVYFLEYEGSVGLKSSFYPRLESAVNQLRLDIKDQWVIVNMIINKDSAISRVDVISSINDQVLEHNLEQVLRKLDKWTAMRVNQKPVDTPFYLALIVDKGRVIVANALVN